MQHVSSVFYIDSFHVKFQDLQIVNLTYCDTEGLLIFEGVTNTLILLLFLFLFVLSVLTTTVPSSIFRREGLSASKASLIIILPTPFLFIIRVTLVVSRLERGYEVLFWFETIWTILIPFILMLVLFIPTVSPNK